VSATSRVARRSPKAVAIEGAKAGEAEKARRIAEADAVRAEGEAAGAAILAKGQAEAQAMELRAQSYSHYNQAAVLEMLVSVLPAMAREVAAPMGQIEKLTVISTDGANAPAEAGRRERRPDHRDAQEHHRRRPPGAGEALHQHSRATRRSPTVRPAPRRTGPRRPDLFDTHGRPTLGRSFVRPRGRSWICTNI